MKKKIFGILMTCMLCLGLTACGGTGDEESITGKVSLNGSTSMEKFVNALSEAITEEYPDLQLEAQFTGSSAGLEALASGSADIGDSSRALTDEEKEKGLVENIVAIDGIAMITNKSNTVENLTTEQLTKIYTGEIKNWKEIGGPDQAIVVIGRESGSGTRGAFEELLKIEDQCQYAQELNETGAVLAKVAETDGAIGYVSLDVVDDTVVALKLNDVTPSEKTIKDGSYQLQRPFVMATKGEISEQKGNVRAIFNFIDSDAGQEVIKKVGLISAK
ncbi:MAG: phosphate ABC transporter substrate-binding protein [Faecalibacillus sp.]